MHPEQFMRFNEDIKAYNHAACNVMERLGVSVNDLYSAAKALPKSAWSDSTHLYTPLGTRALGGAVAQAIRSQWAQ